MDAGGRILRRLSLIVAIPVLTACVSAPSRSPAEQGTHARPAARSSGKTTSPPVTRGGGYYKNDGPGSNPPSSPESIPDAVPRAEPLLSRANRPYRVFGTTYKPRTRVEPFRQRGVASWYGRRFHGLRTSSGEPYDMYAMTAAHPTLPIPSYARVTLRSSGQSVIVRVNDRGPFLHGRIIDLSWAAAAKLGYVNRGSAEVEVEQILPGTLPDDNAPPVPEPRQMALPQAVPPEMESVQDDDPIGAVAAAMGANMASSVENPAAVVTPNGQDIYLQLGVFALRENAEEFRARAGQRAGRLELIAENGYFRVYAGPYASLSDADAAAGKIGEILGIRPFIVRRDRP